MAATGNIPTSLETRPCRTTHVALIGSAGEHAYRLSKTSYGPLDPIRRDDRNPVETWGRYDVAEHSTIYAGSTEATAYAELLAHLLPNKPLMMSPASNYFPEDDDANEVTIGELVSEQWREQWHHESNQVVQNLRSAYSLYELTLPRAGWFIDIEHSETIAAFNNNPQWLARLNSLGIDRLTTADLHGMNRDKTTAIADILWNLVLDDGSRPHGVRFRSKHGSDLLCWAIWLRKVDDGIPATSEPTKASTPIAIDPPARNRALRTVAQQMGLRIS